MPAGDDPAVVPCRQSRHIRLDLVDRVAPRLYLQPHVPYRPRLFHVTSSPTKIAVRLSRGRPTVSRCPRGLRAGDQRSLPNAGVSLDRVRDLLARLGNPHQRLSIVHVAGTKGKGSTAAMTGAILRAAGYRTGVFTSPHLARVEERIAVDGQPIPPDEFAALLERVAPVVEAMDLEAAACDPPEDGPTYFDITTAMGLLHFVDRGVEAAVLEVGLGGRLDSTNVCQPCFPSSPASASTIRSCLAILWKPSTGKKPGIIKFGVPVVSGVLSPGPRRSSTRRVAESTPTVESRGRLRPSPTRHPHE